MGMLRPEKSWRPIITLEVDGQHKHEVILGVDGQNPNQRDIMLLHHAHHHTQIKLDVWHKSQSKKSRKRRHLVASASMALGDAIKKQGTEAHMVFRLSSVPRIPASRRKSIAQKSEPYASLLVRLRPPQSAIPFLIEHDRLSSASSGKASPSHHQGTMTFLILWLRQEQTTRTRSAKSQRHGQARSLKNHLLVFDGARKPKVTCINSEEERSGESDYPLSGSEAEDTKADTWEPPIPHDESSDTYPDSLEIRQLPTHLQRYPYFPPYFRQVITFDTLTYHRELREAQATQLDSNFDRIHRKLIQEWYYIGASLFSIIAVDTTVFGFSSGNLFGVDSVAKRALSISSVASALGLFVDVWLIFVYSGADGRKFQTLAVDLYGSYFFFALSSRLPFVALFVAVLALVVFLGAVAWIAWPAAVLVMCVLAGVLVSLQFIVYGFHRLGLGLAWMVRGVWFGVLYVSRAACAFLGRGAATAIAAQGEQRVVPPATPVRQVVAPPASAGTPGPVRHMV
ncbi:hypothetical protein EDB84DRAFT_1444178 [Lactarius hengduanensis]|nr:hypothetical protein EDB84DRAFT_1444178 [Lactarius hengduanensis]